MPDTALRWMHQDPTDLILQWPNCAMDAPARKRFYWWVPEDLRLTLTALTYLVKQRIYSPPSGKEPNLPDYYDRNRGEKGQPFGWPLLGQNAGSYTATPLTTFFCTAPTGAALTAALAANSFCNSAMISPTLKPSEASLSV